MNDNDVDKNDGNSGLQPRCISKALGFWLFNGTAYVIT